MAFTPIIINCTGTGYTEKLFHSWLCQGNLARALEHCQKKITSVPLCTKGTHLGSWYYLTWHMLQQTHPGVRLRQGQNVMLSTSWLLTRAVKLPEYGQKKKKPTLCQALHCGQTRRHFSRTRMPTMGSRKGTRVWGKPLSKASHGHTCKALGCALKQEAWFQ